MTDSALLIKSGQAHRATKPPGSDGTPLVLQGAFALFMVFAALAFGCMEAWSISISECLLMLGLSCGGWSDQAVWRIPRHLFGPFLLASVLLLFGALQSVPLPSAFIGFLKPDRVLSLTEGARAELLLRGDAYRLDPLARKGALPPESDPATPFTPPLPRALPLSFAPSATARGILATVAALCMILILERMGASWATLRRMGLVVGLAGCAVAVLAIAQYGGLREAILGLRSSPYAVRAFGPFVNRSHGVAFLNLALPFVYFLLWRDAGHRGRRPNRLGKRTLLFALAGVHAGLLVLAGSRSSLLVVLLYPTFFLAHMARKRHVWAGVALCAFLLLAGVGAWFGLDSGILSDTVRGGWNREAWASRGIFGAGLNAFAERFPAVVTQLPLRETMYSTHLENEYLQLLFEVGFLPAAMALVLACVALLLALRAVRVAPSMLWTAPAFLAETVHAGVDFTGHVFPIVGAYLLHWLWLAKAGAGIDSEGDPA